MELVLYLLIPLPSFHLSRGGCRLIFGFFDSRKGIVLPAGGLSRRKELRHGIENDR